MKSSLKLSIVICIVLAVLPFVIIFITNNFSYPKVPVEIVDDSLYYFSRAVEVKEGNYFLGNSYLAEHKKDPTPAFFVADWFWSIPTILGLSLNQVIVVNQIIWFILFGIILFYLFKEFSIDEKKIPWFVLVSTIFVYWFLARPIAMSVVYPIFLLFLLFFIRFIKNPSKINIIYLSFISTVSLYLYTYLTQIIFVILFSAIIFFLFKNKMIFKRLFVVGFLSVLLSLPFILYTIKQINHPLYFETLARIGLVSTNIIGSSAFLYLLIIFFGTISIYLFKNYFSYQEKLFIVFTSVGLVIATISNVFTGKDLETAVHIGRFVELWSIIIFLLITSRVGIISIIKTRKVFILLIFIIFTIYPFLYQIKVWRSLNRNVLSNQVYSSSLNIINKSNKNIISSNDSFSSYIPILENKDVLFHPNILLYMVSDREVEDRYLLSRVFTNLTLDEIKKDMRKYAGAGHTAHRSSIINRDIKICRLVNFVRKDRDCGEFTDPYKLKGEQYFVDLLNRFVEMKKDPIGNLKKYNVSFIVKDKEKDNWVLPGGLLKVFDDSRFEIYEI